MHTTTAFLAIAIGLAAAPADASVWDSFRNFMGWQSTPAPYSGPSHGAMPSRICYSCHGGVHNRIPARLCGNCHQGYTISPRGPIGGDPNYNGRDGRLQNGETNFVLVDGRPVLIHN